MSLPPYDGPIGGPSPQVTPLTFRDNLTLLDKLTWIDRWINRELVPYINTNFSELTTTVNEDINRLIEAVNNAIDEVIGNSVTVQDPLVATMLQNSNSATRIALNAILDNYYTKTAADAKFATKVNLESYYLKTQTDALIAGLINDYDPRLDTIEALLAGRLSQAGLDARYTRNFQNPVAVFIGSSNAQIDYGWTAKLAARLGCIHKNFAVGGGGFLSGGAMNFYNQATAAKNDTSFNKNDVKFVFIVDTSNDTRALGNVEAQSRPVFSLFETEYPNARIIVVPEVLTHDTPNLGSDVRRQVGRIYNSLRNVASEFTRVEIIKNTELWFWDGGAWVGNDGNKVHLTTAGYDKLVWYIQQYLKTGEHHSNDLGDATGAVSGNNGVIHSRRFNGLVHTYGNFTLSADQNTSTKLMIVYAGMLPIENIPLYVTRKSDGAVRVLSFETNGDINLQVPVPAGTWYFNTTYYTV